MTQFVGILPAAGVASRLRPFRYPKELLPVVYVPDSSSGGLRPKLTIEFSLSAMRAADVRHNLVIIADWKLEIVRLLGDGEEHGVSLAYLHRAVPRGLADAVDAGFEWFLQRNVCLALPDSIFTPVDAVAQIRNALDSHRFDLMLGVFPTKYPEKLGPVRMAPSDSGPARVLEVQEKPEQSDVFNTWGIAAWSPRFSEFLHQALARCETEEARKQSIGRVFDAAVREGLRVGAVYFPNGSYTDLGMADSIASLILPSAGGSE